MRIFGDGSGSFSVVSSDHANDDACLLAVEHCLGDRVLEGVLDAGQTENNQVLFKLLGVRSARDFLVRQLLVAQEDGSQRLVGKFGDSFFEFCLISLIDSSNLVIFIQKFSAIGDQYLRCALAENIIFAIFVQPANGGHPFPVRTERDRIDHLLALANIAVIMPVVVYHLQKSALCLVSHLLKTATLDLGVCIRV